MSAGGNLTATAREDLSMVVSEVEARRDLALQAGRDLTLAAAANDSQCSLYDMSKKDGWGSKQTQRD
ncbi:hemagglutinin repeat-containing protein [Pseudomonas sp. NY15374]|uniref:hemagglutinin repeat-containing protein n=1 Tax=Pseudomonas sp. NY15374 TaxID=3400357 RepID=UPI003A84D170